ncbi:hypothetical protein [Octadecabacter arcticus]|jgi:hypothetical protein|uniref:hypothetical protein n=1 Tax=Octadecabacter arcticus TaxID=53946 RepID=UPI001181C20E|nr:hypothetical protein [Octadecabacter arcticus]
MREFCTSHPSKTFKLRLPTAPRRPKAHQQPQDATLLHLKPLEELTFDPDGLSGGPNFVIQQLGRNFSAYFAGITVRAGRNDLYMVKSGFIKTLLDAAIELRA